MLNYVQRIKFPRICKEKRKLPNKARQRGWLQDYLHNLESYSWVWLHGFGEKCGHPESWCSTKKLLVNDGNLQVIKDSKYTVFWKKVLMTVNTPHSLTNGVKLTTWEQGLHGQKGLETVEPVNTTAGLCTVTELDTRWETTIKGRFEWEGTEWQSHAGRVGNRLKLGWDKIFDQVQSRHLS